MLDLPPTAFDLLDFNSFSYLTPIPQNSTKGGKKKDFRLKLGIWIWASASLLGIALALDIHKEKSLWRSIKNSQYINTRWSAKLLKTSTGSWVQEKKIDKFAEDNNKSGGIYYPWCI